MIKMFKDFWDFSKDSKLFVFLTWLLASPIWVVFGIILAKEDPITRILALWEFLLNTLWLLWDGLWGIFFLGALFFCFAVFCAVYLDPYPHKKTPRKTTIRKTPSSGSGWL